MGLFDPPAVGIRKHIPSGGIPTFDQLAGLTRNAIPNHLNSTKAELVVGFVVASWALSEHRRGSLDLSTKDGAYISNMGSNCVRMLGAQQEIAISMVQHLVEQGVILEPD